MVKTSFEFTCLECGYKFTNETDLSSCIKCKSTNLFKNVSVEIAETLTSSVSMSYKGKSKEKTASKKHPIFDFGHEETENHLGEPVALDYSRNRKEDSYFKTVTSLKTGDVKIVRDKKLTEHLGFRPDKKNK